MGGVEKVSANRIRTGAAMAVDRREPDLVLAELDKLARLLDTRWRIPGTGYGSAWMP